MPLELLDIGLDPDVGAELPTTPPTFDTEPLLELGLEPLCIESQVDDRDRNATGESPPTKLGGRERDFLSSIKAVSSSEKSVEPSSSLLSWDSSVDWHAEML
uniref:Uncharacterized protein n=1 Tax=Anopheles minimus TaxID=112268 RepID=A0A182WJ10_9DIPT